MWIGTVFNSAETFIATPHRVFRAGCIRRKVVAERWSVPLTEAIRGKSSEPVPGSGDWKIPTYVRPELSGSEIETPDDTESAPQPPEEERPTVRLLYVRRADVETHGPKAVCARCKSIALNRQSTTLHTDNCRQRFTQLLMGTGKSVRRVQRIESRVIEETARRAELLRNDDTAEHTKRQRTSANDNIDPRGRPRDDADMSDAPNANSDPASAANPFVDVAAADPARERIERG